MPKVSIRAVQAALETNKNRITTRTPLFRSAQPPRASIAKLIGGKPEEVALTSGRAPAWRRGVRVDLEAGRRSHTAKASFPCNMHVETDGRARGPEAEIVSPRERFITADDLIAAITPRTRMVSVSMVRFDDGRCWMYRALPRRAAHKGAAFTGRQPVLRSLPMDVNNWSRLHGMRRLQVAAGPVRTGFFWAKSEHLGCAAGAVLLMALMGSHNFAALNFDDPKLAANANGGFAGVGQLFQFQPGGHGRFRRFRGANGAGAGRCAQPQIN